MKISTSVISVFVISLAAACGSDDPEAIDPGAIDGRCDESTRVGGFAVELEAAFTRVGGTVADAVAPQQISEIVDRSGDCVFRRSPLLFCDPVCDAASTCDASGQCVPLPQAVSVGTVVVEGLKSAVTMEAAFPFFYMNRGDLEHPGFDEGAEIVLRAGGADAVARFALGVNGVAPLTLPSTTIALDQGQPMVVTWDAPPDPTLGRVTLDLDISSHGGNFGSVACAVADTGSFEVPVALTDQLLGFGFAGFPQLTVTRESADSTTTDVGCVELSAESAAIYDVEIDGLTSCSDDDDCTPPETCQPDLVCG